MSIMEGKMVQHSEKQAFTKLNMHLPQSPVITLFGTCPENKNLG